METSVYGSMQAQVEVNAEGKIGTVRNAAKRAIMIPARQAIIIEGEVPLPSSDMAYDVIMEPRAQSRLPEGIVVDQNIIRLNKERQKTNRVPVLVQNQTDNPVWVYRNDVLGELYLCEIQGLVQTNTQSVETKDVRSGDGIVDGLDFSELPASPEDVEHVKRVIGNYSHAFSQSDTDLGRSSIIEHTIPLTNSQPFMERYRRIPLPCMRKYGTTYGQCTSQMSFGSHFLLMPAPSCS